jgi:hypothetical protein
VVPRRDLTQLLGVLNPSELALRDWVGPQLNESMLEDIAAADYGFNASENRRALEELRRDRWLPDELSCYPEEVLTLTRWSRVESQLSPEQARRIHLMRIFCCLVLVRATTMDASPVNSVTPLVESAVELGPDAVDAAGRFLAWCWLHEPGDWREDPRNRPILTLALVVLSTLLPAGRDPELLPALVADFVEDLSAVLAEEYLLWSEHPVRALLKLTAMDGGNRRIWVSLAGRCLIDGPAQHIGHAAVLAQLGRAITGDLAADAAELRSLLVPGADA